MAIVRSAFPDCKIYTHPTGTPYIPSGEGWNKSAGFSIYVMDLSFFICIVRQEQHSLALYLIIHLRAAALTIMKKRLMKNETNFSSRVV